MTTDYARQEFLGYQLSAVELQKINTFITRRMLAWKDLDTVLTILEQGKAVASE